MKVIYTFEDASGFKLLMVREDNGVFQVNSVDKVNNQTFQCEGRDFNQVSNTFFELASTHTLFLTR